jgi:hypothetical protein
MAASETPPEGGTARGRMSCSKTRVPQILSSQNLCALVAVAELPWVTAQILEARPRVARVSVFPEPAVVRWVLGWPLMAWPPALPASLSTEIDLPGRAP